MSGIAAALMFVSFAIMIIVRIELDERRRRGCDGCRVEALGSSLPYIEHSCSKSRAKYRDRKGRVYEFGKRLTNGSQIARRG